MLGGLQHELDQHTNKAVMIATMRNLLLFFPSFAMDAFLSNSNPLFSSAASGFFADPLAGRMSISHSCAMVNYIATQRRNKTTTLYTTGSMKMCMANGSRHGKSQRKPFSSASPLPSNQSRTGIGVGRPSPGYLLNSDGVRPFGCQGVELWRNTRKLDET